MTIGMSRTYSYSAGNDQVLSRNDDTDFSYIAFGGYQFLKYFGLAGAWVDLGTTKYAGTISDGGAFTDELSVKGFSIMPMGMFPLKPHHALFAYSGVYRWSQDVNYNDAVSGPYRSTDRGWSPTAGFGYNWYAIDHNLGIHVEYSRFFSVGDKNNSGHVYDRDFFSAGMIWSFR